MSILPSVRNFFEKNIVKSLERKAKRATFALAFGQKSPGAEKEFFEKRLHKKRQVVREADAALRGSHPGKRRHDRPFILREAR